MGDRLLRRAWVLLLILVPLASLGAERVVRVGVFPAPPLVIVEKGKPQGLFIDLVEEFARLEKWKVEYVPGLWGDQLAALEKGTIDLLPSIGHTQARERLYSFSRDPVFIDSGVVFATRSAVVHTLYDLKGKRVAALDKSIFTEAFGTNMAAFGLDFQLIPEADNSAVMQAVVSGQADVGVSISSLGNYLTRTFPVVATPVSFSPVALEFAVPLGKGEDLLAAINRHMATMVSDADSVYSRSYQRWTQPPEATSLPPWFWWGLGVLVFAGILLGAWNLSLKRLVAVQTGHLLEEKERLAVTLKSIADGVVTTDTEGRVQLMNPVAERLCGWSQDEAVGRPVGEVVVLTPLADGVPRTELLSRDGARYRVNESQAPIRDGTGLVLGTVRILRDMTERERLLDTLQRTDKLEALGVLAGGIAHDFNNLLAGLFGFIDLAKRSDVGPRGLAYLDKALAVFSRAKALSYQLLTFSKGGAPLKKTTDLDSLIRETASFAGAGSNLRIEFDLVPDLWRCDVDENQMSQVFGNLILNARQAMPDGGRLTVSGRNLRGPDPSQNLVLEGPVVCLTFADEGEGIPLELQPKVFDPFFTTKATGHGLGLSTGNSIVLRHGGLLDFQSTPGRGTTFRLLLPARPGALAESSAPVAASGQGTGTILVLDDEEFLVEILTQELGNLGYQVLSAAHGGQVLDLLDHGPGSVTLQAAFLDLTIPGGKGGREIIATLRQRLPDLPIFASSGFSDDPVMAEPERYGFTASIRKPFRAEDLRALLNHYLS